MNRFVVLLLFVKLISPCKDMWDNTCANDRDCCSQHCDRSSPFMFGVCKPDERLKEVQTSELEPERTKGTQTCQENWTDKCQNNRQCCSRKCDRPAQFEFGVCKPQSTNTDEIRHENNPQNCQENWSNKCQNNYQCCSKYCDRPVQFAFGVCKPQSQQPVEMDHQNNTQKCREDWYNKCQNNYQCCSQNCDRTDHFEFGVCKPQSPNADDIEHENNPQNCQENWSNKCQNNDHCCSKYCDRPAHFEFGVCKPQSPQTGEMDHQNNTPKCQEDWTNKCQSNYQCCSQNCDRPDHFEFGVCKPQSPNADDIEHENHPQNCQENWSNKCQNNDHCCSKYCDRPAHFEFGVCKPQSLQTGEMEHQNNTEKCQEDWSNKCQSNYQCCSKNCVRLVHFEFGVCKPLSLNTDGTELETSQSPSTDQAEQENHPQNCHEDWYDYCQNNYQCCSRKCDRPGNIEFGVCVPGWSNTYLTGQENNPGICLMNWSGQCQYNDQCCSGKCERPERFQFGQCVPGWSPRNGPELDHRPDMPRCERDQYNQCKINSDCCSKFCDRPEISEYGICKTKCKEDWDNKCKTNDDCCSNSCERPDGFEFGVCNPNFTAVESESSEPGSCKPIDYNLCRRNSTCCSGYCYMGPNEEWKYGVCKNETVQFNNLEGNGTCHKLWYNGCTNLTRCCSGHCYMGELNNWEYGVCKWPDLRKEKVILAKQNNSQVCRLFQEGGCEKDIDCCSGYCYKGANTEKIEGVCQNVQLILQYKLHVNTSTTCTQKEEETCKHNRDCCTGICSIPSNTTGLSVCKPSEYYWIFSVDRNHMAAQNNSSECTPLYQSGCKLDENCCGNYGVYCWYGPQNDWLNGVCRPLPYTIYNTLSDNATKVCYEDWYDYCLSDSECCSGVCYMDKIWTYGACLPGNGRPIRNKRNVFRKKRSPENRKLMVCYIGTWANYKLSDGKFTIEDIDHKLCTHVVYGFAKLEGNEIKAFDPWLDLSRNETGGSLDAYRRFTGLKQDNPGLKTLIAIGGWNEGSEKYSSMAATPSGRSEFAKSVLEFLTKYGFDGIDIDWEYPSTRGGQASDKLSFNALLDALSDTLRPHGLTLSAAVAANPRTVETGYDVPYVAKKVDFISIMSYDYHGAFDKVTGHNAPLFNRPDDEDKTFNVNYGIRYWLAKGAPASKIVMGMPLHGRAVALKIEDKNGLLAPIKGSGEPGKYSGEPGAIYYREICELLKNEKGWDERWDTTTMTPYMVKGDQWISYDNIASLKYKAIYAHKLGLAGAMVWSMESDDFRDTCGYGKNPLLNAIVDTINNPPDLTAKEENKKEKKCTKSSVDSIPILSQLKSLFQAIGGDKKCAKETQENFVRTVPVISQITSAVQAAGGDPEEARKTQLAFLKNLEEQVDGTPLLGHIKGSIHVALGDNERGEQVLKEATRPLAVIGGGIVGAAVGGPAGAVAGGLAGGAAYDGVVTGIDSATKGDFSAYGTIDSIPRVFKSEADAGEVFDTVTGLVSDGVGGFGAKGLMSRQQKSRRKGTKVLCRRRRQAGGGCNWNNEFNDIPSRHDMPNIQWFDDQVTHVRPSPGLSSPARFVDPAGRLATREVQINRNAHNRVEYVRARITKNNLKKGTDTNELTREYTAEMGNKNPNYHKDDAGHIIANSLGGSGTDPTNIFPQTKLYNRGDWKGIERIVYDEVNTHGDRFFTIKLVYENSQSTRPTKILYKIERPDGSIVQAGDMENPLVPANTSAKDYKK